MPLMSSQNGPSNQPPRGYPSNTPKLPAPTGVPSASSGQFLNPLCPTRTYPGPPTQYQGAGPHPSSSGGCYVSRRSENTPHIPPKPEFTRQQKVKARITTNAWVIGIIVSALHVCSKFTGVGYTVEFESVEGSGRYETREFSVEDLSPYWPRE